MKPYTIKQATGVATLRNWLYELNDIAPTRKFLHSGVVDAPVSLLLSWIETRMDDTHYNEDTALVLNTLRLFYNLNKDKKTVFGEDWVWEIRIGNAV